MAVSALGGVGAWAHLRASAPKPELHDFLPKVGIHPGGVGEGKVQRTFLPAPGNELAGFSAGCFWGSEEAFRRIPGIVATAVGYTGGTSAFPTYEEAHATGHAETVLVEFNPKITPFSQLLQTFWKLHRTTDAESTANAKSPYRAAIWTYSGGEYDEAIASRRSLELRTHSTLRTRIQPAQPFYLAEEYHQQYDEKSGTDACPFPGH